MPNFTARGYLVVSKCCTAWLLPPEPTGGGGVVTPQNMTQQQLCMHKEIFNPEYSTKKSLKTICGGENNTFRMLVDYLWGRKQHIQDACRLSGEGNNTSRMLVEYLHGGGGGDNTSRILMKARMPVDYQSTHKLERLTAVSTTEGMVSSSRKG